MNGVKIIKRDEKGQIIKIFDGFTQYEGLKTGDVVEIEDVGALRDYVVVDTRWEFTHFGNMYEVVIEPVDLRQPTVKAYIVD